MDWCKDWLARQGEDSTSKEQNSGGIRCMDGYGDYVQGFEGLIFNSLGRAVRSELYAWLNRKPNGIIRQCDGINIS